MVGVSMADVEYGMVHNHHAELYLVERAMQGGAKMDRLPKQRIIRHVPGKKKVS
jgi:hypothetical protein